MLSFASALVMTSMALFGSAQLPSDCARAYTVQLGDTCFSISAANNVSTFQLAFVNSQINSDCSDLAEGEPLCLGITGQDCNVTSVINSGDTCATIDTAAGIPFATLLHNNPNINSGCTNIEVGEVLCTSSELFTYTA